LKTAMKRAIVFLLRRKGDDGRGSAMTRLARLAAVLPIAAAAVLFSSGTAGATSAAASCDPTFSFGGAKVTVRCEASNPGTEFRAVAYCPNGSVHFGPWVLQGPGHVSVAGCANPMIAWDRDLR
jgi:hypothetical protein